MKKIAVIMFAAVVGALGSSPSFAQTLPDAPNPELCAESDGLTPAEIQLCSSVDDDGVGIDIYPLPPTLPPETTDPGTTTTTIGVIPPTLPPRLAATGSSGTSGFLQLGALMMTGGLLVVIAARRRSTVRLTTA